MKTCPTPGCGALLADRAVTCNDCGWEAPRRHTRDKSGEAPETAYRCAWVANGERCRFAGSLGFGTRGDGERYCRGHFNLNDQAHGQRIVEESVRAVPALFDWSAKAIVTATEKAYLEHSQYGPLTDRQRALAWRVCPQWCERAGWTRPSADAEADAERFAIEHDDLLFGKLPIQSRVRGDGRQAGVA